MNNSRHIIIVFALLYSGIYSIGAEFKITPITVGDNSIVDAIKKYSNITPSYVNRWKPVDWWFIGASVRSHIANVINNYINVCKNLDLARISFEDEKSLMASFPVHWTISALCAALKNLKDQGMYALALVGYVQDTGKQAELNSVITSYLKIIDHNRSLLHDKCDELLKKREEKRSELVKLALDKATINEKKAKSWSDKFSIVKSIDALVNPLPTLSTPLIWALLYAANRINFFDSFLTVEDNE